MQKAKSFDKLPKSVLRDFYNTKYLASIKYDGNQIFITGTQLTTSQGKPFTLPVEVLAELPNVNGRTLVAEFMYGCIGKLGDRRKSAILTTARTEYAKGLPCSLEADKVNIKVFDIIDTRLTAKERLDYIQEVLDGNNLVTSISPVIRKGTDAFELRDTVVEEGWEGVMLLEPNSLYKIGKRVNQAIKLKGRYTADIKCVDVLEGEGKYQGMIGSLVLHDNEGRLVQVGSGLTDELRDRDPEYFIGKVIEIGYEQIIDTYIQPTFIAVREDK